MRLVMECLFSLVKKTSVEVLVVLAELMIKYTWFYPPL